MGFAAGERLHLCQAFTTDGGQHGQGRRVSIHVAGRVHRQAGQHHRQALRLVQNGEVEITTSTPDITFHVTPQSAAYWNEWVSKLGVLICGRTLFDFTDGWGGTHTMGIPVVVVTHTVPTEWVESHPEAPFTFVTDGIASAVEKAQAIAGERTVAVEAGTIARQCLELGLLDEVAVDLVPVVMGKGRPFFGEMGIEDVMLGNPIVNVAGDRATHLVFPVVR